MVPQLLILLKDMNWPGALGAAMIMRNLNPGEISPYIKEALIQADNEEDTERIAWIKEFIEDLNVRDQYKDLENILIKADH